MYKEQFLLWTTWSGIKAVEEKLDIKMKLTIFYSKVIIKMPFLFGLNGNELLAIYARTYKTMYSKNKTKLEIIYFF